MDLNQGPRHNSAKTTELKSSSFLEEAMVALLCHGPCWKHRLGVVLVCDSVVACYEDARVATLNQCGVVSCLAMMEVLSGVASRLDLVSRLHPACSRRFTMSFCSRGCRGGGLHGDKDTRLGVNCRKLLPTKFSSGLLSHSLGAKKIY